MKILTLVENTSASEEYGCEHGLSFYVETEAHKLLFDVGASSLFVENAEKLGVNLAEIDTLVISHGHNDHGGGLKTFLNLNDKATVYVNKQSFEKHYTKRSNGEIDYIGLDQELFSNKQLVFLEDDHVIDDELCIFANVQGHRFQSTANQDLLMEKNDVMDRDDFSHEQNLIIREKNQVVLMAGCAHNGITNIMDHLASNYDIYPTCVIGGFHLSSRSREKAVSQELIENIGKELLKTSAQFYTCHCTGEAPYGILKDILAERIDYLAAGSQVNI